MGSPRCSYSRDSSRGGAVPKVLRDVGKCVLFGEPAGVRGAASDVLNEGFSTPALQPSSHRFTHCLLAQGRANLVVRDRQALAHRRGLPIQPTTYRDHRFVFRAAVVSDRYLHNLSCFREGTRFAHATHPPAFFFPPDPGKLLLEELIPDSDPGNGTAILPAVLSNCDQILTVLCFMPLVRHDLGRHRPRESSRCHLASANRQSWDTRCYSWLSPTAHFSLSRGANTDPASMGTGDNPS